VQRLEVGQGTARYEPVQPGGDHHHHMVCDSCGSVVPFEDSELERSIERLSARVKFSVAEHDVVLHGACADCAG
jgi:Fur family ferric uptake transcriptional regulator